MSVERSTEVSAWMKSCGSDFVIVEKAAVLFESNEDQEKFENVLWPHLPAEGIEIC